MIFIIVALLFVFYVYITLFSSQVWCPRLFNYVFFHKDYLLWERVLKCIDTIELFDEMSFDGDAYFKINVDGQKCHIWVWKDKTISIHGDSEGPITCMTTTFDPYHNKLCKKLIFERVKDKLDKKYYYLFENQL